MDTECCGFDSRSNNDLSRRYTGTEVPHQETPRARFETLQSIAINEHAAVVSPGRRPRRARACTNRVRDGLRNRGLHRLRTDSAQAPRHRRQGRFHLIPLFVGAASAASSPSIGQSKNSRLKPLLRKKSQTNATPDPSRTNRIGPPEPNKESSQCSGPRGS